MEQIGKKSPDKFKNKKKHKKYKLYVYRFLSDGELSNAKPCAECSRWMYIASLIGVDYDVYYTDDDKKLKSYDFMSTHYVPKHTYFANNVYNF